MRIGLLYKVMIVQRFGKFDGLGFSDRFLHNFHDDVSKMLPDCVCVCCLCVSVCCVYLWQFLMCNCTVQSASFGERLSLLDNIPLGWLLLTYNFDFVEWKYLLFIVHSECGCCFSFCFTLVTGFSLFFLWVGVDCCLPFCWIIRLSLSLISVKRFR